MGKTRDIISCNQLNETVAQLYSLRSGLSVISERADIIRELEDDIIDESARSGPIDFKISQNNRQIAEIEEKIKNNEKDISGLQAAIPQKVRSTGGYFLRNLLALGAKSIVGTIFSTLSAILGIVLLVYTITSFSGMIGFSILALFFGIYSPIVFLATYSDARKDKKNVLEMIDNNNNAIKDKQKRITEYNEEIVDIERANEKLYMQKKEREVEIAQNISKLKNDIVSIAQEASLYNTALENEYTRLLNPADWHNIDLCIFYLQTGRADSIKECLLLADRQRQNDEIVGAIKAAGERICGEIRNGFKALGSTVVACINSLSMQIEAVSSSLATQHDETIRALGAVESSNAALLSATQLNNALQAKANATSEALMRDYKYVQNRIDIAI